MPADLSDVASGQKTFFSVAPAKSEPLVPRRGTVKAGCRNGNGRQGLWVNNRNEMSAWV
jgi:hypothetical protein